MDEFTSPFTVPGYSPGPPEEVRHAVCAMFTEGTASFMQHVTGGSIYLEPRALLTRCFCLHWLSVCNVLRRHVHFAILLFCRWFDCLSECGDPSCGCNRIKLPHVRADFCKRVCTVTVMPYYHWLFAAAHMHCVTVEPLHCVTVEPLHCVTVEPLPCVKAPS